MTDRDTLADLFAAAGKAHHQAYLSTDGADPEWPLWYAEHLHEALAEHLGARFTRSELVYLIVLADKTLQYEAPGASWPTYYADFFLARYG